MVRALSLKDKGGSLMVLALGGTGPTNYLPLPQLGVGGRVGRALPALPSGLPFQGPEGKQRGPTLGGVHM